VIGRFVFGDEAVVAESQPVEAAVEREVFVDFVDGFAVFGVKRRQAFDSTGGRAMPEALLISVRMNIPCWIMATIAGVWQRIARKLPLQPLMC